MLKFSTHSKTSMRLPWLARISIAAQERCYNGLCKNIMMAAMMLGAVDVGVGQRGEGHHTDSSLRVRCK